MCSEIQSPDLDPDTLLDEEQSRTNSFSTQFSTHEKKQMMLNIKKKWREDRNMKNFYKVELIFGF